MKAISHAMRHCTSTVSAAAPLPPISRLTVAMAATQGVYSSVNTKNTLALKGVKYREVSAGKLLSRNLLIYGLGGIITPFIFIKLIDILLVAFHLV